MAICPRSKAFCEHYKLKYRKNDCVKNWEKTIKTNSLAEEELLKALRNEKNKVMPYLRDEVKKLFFSLGIKWYDLQRMVYYKEDIFAAKPQDRKITSAGE